MTKFFAVIAALIGALFFVNGLLSDPTGSAVRQIVQYLNMVIGGLFFVVAAALHSKPKQ